MATPASVKTSIDTNITNQTADDSISPATVGTEMKKIVDLTTPVLISATLEIPFDSTLSVIPPLTLTEDIVIIPDETGAVAGNGAMRRITGDGESTVDLSAFKTGSDPALFIFEDGITKLLVFIYDGEDYIVYISAINDVDVPVPPEPEVVALLMSAARTNVTTITNGIQSGAGDPGSFGNTALDALHLPAGQNGWIQLKFVGSQNYGTMLGFNTANAQTGYTGMEAGMFISALEAIYKIDSGGIGSAIESLGVNTYYRITRTGSTLTLGKGSDGVTATTIATFTFSSAADLYIVSDMGGGGQQILFLTGFNLI